MNINFELHSLNKQTISSLIIMGAIALVAIIVGLVVKTLDPRKKTPVALVPFIMIVSIINNVVKESFGKRWKAYAPYILTLTLFIFLSNISGIFGLETPTSYLIIDAALAFTVFLVIQFTGLISLGPKKYFLPLLNPMNLVSEITLPVSLTLRLMGNIMSGAVLTSLLKGLVGINPVFYAVDAVVLPVMNLIFDIFFGTIQTLVFILLTSIFGSMKVSEKDLVIEDNKKIHNELVEE